jgi:hypothetical protein
VRAKAFARDLRNELLDSMVTSARATALLRFLTERQRGLVLRDKLMVNDALDAPPRQRREPLELILPSHAG